MSQFDAGRLAAELLDLGDDTTLRHPITDGFAEFDLAAAYRVSAGVIALRKARGETPVGWKIGFTNKTIWPRYDVYAPIWGPVYDTTTAVISGDAERCDISRMTQPRIEPEIVFRLSKTPKPESDEDTLLECIDGIAHGFEIVQCPFPDWRFKAPDTVAVGALHGLLRHRPFTDVTSQERARWRHALENFTITLSRDGMEIDRGIADNVLGGPLSALKALVDGLPKTPLGVPLHAGDIVTTGTITDAHAISAGECWSTRIVGLDVAPMTLRFE